MRSLLPLWIGLGAVGAIVILVLALLFLRPRPSTTADLPRPTLVTATRLIGFNPTTAVPIPTSPPTPASTSPRPTVPTPSPTPDLHGAIEKALWDYVWLRKQAEEQLTPELLRQVCVEPYLTWKMDRIKENISSGTHWETPAVDFTITSLTSLSPDRVEVIVRKTETKLFYPKGSSKPDDEVCGRTIYSYRECTYEAHYTMVLKEGHWYVSDAQAPGANCQGRCQH